MNVCVCVCSWRIMNKTSVKCLGKIFAIKIARIRIPCKGLTEKDFKIDSNVNNMVKVKTLWNLKYTFVCRQNDVGEGGKQVRWLEARWKMSYMFYVLVENIYDECLKFPCASATVSHFRKYCRMALKSCSFGIHMVRVCVHAFTPFPIDTTIRWRWFNGIMMWI